MKIEDIIESLNRHIENKRKELNINPKSGHLILQKTVKPHEVFKAYKQYSYIVWFVYGGIKHRVITLNCVERVTDGHEERVIAKISNELCVEIFNWMSTDLYSQVIKGEYKE